MKCEPTCLTITRVVPDVFHPFKALLIADVISRSHALRDVGLFSVIMPTLLGVVWNRTLGPVAGLKFAAAACIFVKRLSVWDLRLIAGKSHRLLLPGPRPMVEQMIPLVRTKAGTIHAALRVKLPAFIGHRRRKAWAD